MRNKLILISIFACSAPAMAQVNIRLGLPSIDIGVNLNVYPELIPVPGYPVYYAPQMNSNYFFYDGMYWVYQDEDWYASSWYNGPWRTIDRDVVPVFVLRIPVRYYRQAPIYFNAWHADSAPRWDQHWGNEWQHRRQGWDRWDRHTPSVRPPLPTYQRNYTGDRYPQLSQQQSLQSKNYRYQPRDPLVRQQVQEQGQHALQAPALPIADQRRSEMNSREPNAAQGTNTRDRRDQRDNRRENQRDSHDNQRDYQRDSRDDQRAYPPTPMRNNAPATTFRAESQNVAPPVQPQNHQQERDHAQEQAQQTSRAQRPERPAPNPAAPQEQSRAQKPEQQHDRSNEKSKDRGNERDDERGQDRKK